MLSIETIRRKNGGTALSGPTNPQNASSAKADDPTENLEFPSPDPQPSELSQLQAALKSCDDYDTSHFFSSLESCRLALLPIAYAGFLALKSANQSEVALAAKCPGRERAISVDKPELIALHRTLKPNTTEQRGLCSDWAPLLLIAADEQISSAGFSPWLEKASVSTCKAKI